MPEYLTKEEIRQWRSSLERITLEEYAARLGKLVQGEKQTNDMIDKVMSHSLETMHISTSEYRVPGEKIQTIPFRPIVEKKEQPMKQKEEKVVKEIKEVKKQKPLKVEKKDEEKINIAEKQPELNKKEESMSLQIGAITFKKALIPREQMIFNYLMENKGSIVYAKDMAALLDLPRDYVYKYIKNLRQKLNEEVLFNADNGGYILKV